jgi:hypothetical protein
MNDICVCVPSAGGPGRGAGLVVRAQGALHLPVTRVTARLGGSCHTARQEGQRFSALLHPHGHPPGTLFEPVATAYFSKSAPFCAAAFPRPPSMFIFLTCCNRPFFCIGVPFFVLLPLHLPVTRVTARLRGTCHTACQEGQRVSALLHPHGHPPGTLFEPVATAFFYEDAPFCAAAFPRPPSMYLYLTCCTRQCFVLECPFLRCCLFIYLSLLPVTICAVAFAYICVTACLRGTCHTACQEGERFSALLHSHAHPPGTLFEPVATA